MLGVGHNTAYGAQDENGLDALFEQLTTSSNPFDIRSIEGKITRHWRTTKSPTIKLFMERGRKASLDKSYDLALSQFGYAVEFAPDFIEGWYSRAKLLIHMERLPEAVLDIERVVTLEPRHFLAWMTLGELFLEIDNKNGAYKAFDKALEINPHLNEAKAAVDYLRPYVEGREI